MRTAPSLASSCQVCNKGPAGKCWRERVRFGSAVVCLLRVRFSSCPLAYFMVKRLCLVFMINPSFSLTTLKRSIPMYRQAEKQESASKILTGPAGNREELDRHCKCGSASQKPSHKIWPCLPGLGTGGPFRLSRLHSAAVAS